MTEGVAQIVHDRLRRREEAAYAWAQKTYGSRVQGARYQAFRLLEEALALCRTQGLTLEDFNLAVEHAVTLKPGDTKGEIGDLAVNLLIFAENLGLSVDSCLTDNLNRIQALDPVACLRRDDAKIQLGLI